MSGETQRSIDAAVVHRMAKGMQHLDDKGKAAYIEQVQMSELLFGQVVFDDDGRVTTPPPNSHVGLHGNKR